MLILAPHLCQTDSGERVLDQHPGDEVLELCGHVLGVEVGVVAGDPVVHLHHRGSGEGEAARHQAEQCHAQRPDVR